MRVKKPRFKALVLRGPDKHEAFKKMMEARPRARVVQEQCPTCRRIICKMIYSN